MADIEDLVEEVVTKYIKRIIKRGMSRRDDGCGCNTCYNQAVDMFQWYKGEWYMVNWEPEIMDQRYAHPNDYWNIWMTNDYDDEEGDYY